jgi:putative transposase
LPKVLRVKTWKVVGLDFGIETTVTTSDGDKHNICIPEPIRLRRLKRGQYRRKIKGSRNWIKKTQKAAIEHDNVDNKKKGLKDDLVHKLVKEYDIVVCQDENLKGWKEGWFGKQVQGSCMKGIISDLKHKSETFMRVDRYFPSTQICDVCGNRREVGLSERMFICQSCGNTKDRDTHSAINILNEGLKTLRAMGEHTEHVKTPVEFPTSTSSSSLVDSKLVTVNQEATAPLGRGSSLEPFRGIMTGRKKF